MILNGLLGLPLFFSFLVGILPVRYSFSVGLLGSIFIFVWSLGMTLGFNPQYEGFQFQMNWLDHYAFGVDGMALLFVLLTTVLIPICLLISWNSIRILQKHFVIILLCTEFLLLGVFTTLNLLAFYIFFEGTLIPMFLLIGVWGSREPKIRASYMLFFYTLAGSVIMLIAILKIYDLTGTLDYQTLLAFPFTPEWQNWLWLAFFIAFAVKIPMWPFHIWLPQAHVEAPVAGSVLLAGLLLKLGGFGFLRISLPLFPLSSVYYTPFIWTLSVIAIIYGSLLTLRQTDLKRIVAYSSVAHMGVVTLGIFTQVLQGVVGAVVLMIAHGWVSSALFICVTLLYDRYHTRLIKYYRGVAILMPLFATFFLVFTLANMGFPGSCNFLGEFLTLLGVYKCHQGIAIIATVGVILSAAYSLFCYNRINFGSYSPYLALTSDLTRREFHVLFPLVLLTVYYGIWPQYLLELAASSMSYQFLSQ